jgi:hypothetical protein
LCDLTLLRTRVSAVPSVYYKPFLSIVESPSLYQVPFNKLLLPIPTLNLRRSINSLPRPLPSLATSSPYFHHWLVIFHSEYSTTAQSTFPYVHTGRDKHILKPVGNCNCMASTGGHSFTSRLDHWILSLESEKLSFQSQVQQLDLAISELNSNQPNSPAAQHIQFVRDSLVSQLSSVLQEISDLNLVKHLLVSTQPSIRNYEHLIRLSHRQNRLRHSAEYYQDLSTLFDSIYKYLYQR